MAESQTTNEAALEPPTSFTIRWCPNCGRDDRVQSFKVTHYSRGEICRGEPITIEFSRVSANVAPVVDAQCLICDSSQRHLHAYADHAFISTLDLEVAKREFLNASIAVWREIDRLSALPDGYHGLPQGTDPRKRELAAWEAYRALLDALAKHKPKAAPASAVVQEQGSDTARTFRAVENAYEEAAMIAENCTQDEVARDEPFRIAQTIREQAKARLLTMSTASPAAPASSDAWATWFERLGKKASAEVVNATAELVTNERLAALVHANCFSTEGEDTK